MRFDVETPEFVSVRTGAHWGPVEVATAWLQAAPTAIGDEWEEIAEISVVCGSGLGIGELMGELRQALCNEGGSYRLRISARGRAEAADLGYDELTDERDGTEPVEEYLVEAWPAPIENARTVRVRATAAVDEAGSAPSAQGTYDEEDDDERREAAKTAGQRIGADLDNAPAARPFSRQLGAATLDVLLPREIARVWPLIANLDITNMSGANDAVVGNEFSMSSYDPEQDGFVGTNGEIICQWSELAEPTRVAMTWRWTGTARELEPTTLTATLTDRTIDPEHPLVHLQLTHADLPVEWVDDMTAIWRSKVDQWVYQSMPRKRRR